MSLSPINQTNLFSLDNYLSEFIELYKKKKLPTKILLSGDKGLGKSTLAFHLVNYILSINEEHPYIIAESKINPENRFYKLTINGSNPNLSLVDTLSDKKSIDINQIRELIMNLSKSSFNEKERFVIIDNIETLNISSITFLIFSLSASSLIKIALQAASNESASISIADSLEEGFSPKCLKSFFEAFGFTIFSFS